MPDDVYGFRKSHFEVDGRAEITRHYLNPELMIFVLHKMNFVGVQMEQVKLTLGLDEWLGHKWARRGRDVPCWK